MTNVWTLIILDITKSWKLQSEFNIIFCSIEVLDKFKELILSECYQKLLHTRLEYLVSMFRQVNYTLT